MRISEGAEGCRNTSAERRHERGTSKTDRKLKKAFKNQVNQPDFSRCPGPSQAFKSGDRIKMKTIAREGVMINKETIDLRYVEQITDSEQVTALGHCVKYAQKNILDGRKNLRRIVDELESVIERQSMEELCESRSSVAGMARPRRQEIFACFNRYRSLKL